MSKKKILFFSRDPGGCNCLVPIINNISKDKYDIFIFGKDSALNVYIKNNIIGKNIINFLKEVNEEEIKKFLKNINPDLIITGTSAGDVVEKEIFKISKELKIKSYALIDHWLNYKNRFELDGKFYFPSKIIVIDEYAKNEAIKQGIDKNIIFPLGQPYFETVKKNLEKIKYSDIKKIRLSLGIEKDEKLILFASEPFSELYRNYHYNEITILDKLIKTLAYFKDKKLKILIRPHPKELIEKFDKYRDNKNIIIDTLLNSQEAIMSCDLICGMQSMLLIESFIVNKPIISIQIGINEDQDDFILTKLKLIKTVYNDNQLKINLLKFVSDEYKFSSNGLNLSLNASEKIINLIELDLCQN
jgi:hypothetical protein